jgi:hypothetical protein
MKCWNSEFNAQGSRVTILVVQVEAMKIYGVMVLVLETKIGDDVSGAALIGWVLLIKHKFTHHKI